MPWHAIHWSVIGYDRSTSRKVLSILDLQILKSNSLSLTIICLLKGLYACRITTHKARFFSIIYWQKFENLWLLLFKISDLFLYLKHTLDKKNSFSQVYCMALLIINCLFFCFNCFCCYVVIVTVLILLLLLLLLLFFIVVR